MVVEVDDSLFGTDYSSKGELTASGDISLVTGLDNAKQSIRNWLLTEKGFYPSVDDEYGSEIKLALGEDYDTPNIDALKIYIQNALYDNPRVKDILGISEYLTVKGEVTMHIEVELVNGSEESFNIGLDEV